MFEPLDLNKLKQERMSQRLSVAMDIIDWVCKKQSHINPEDFLYDGLTISVNESHAKAPLQFKKLIQMIQSIFPVEDGENRRVCNILEHTLKLEDASRQLGGKFELLKTLQENLSGELSRIPGVHPRQSMMNIVGYLKGEVPLGKRGQPL